MNMTEGMYLAFPHSSSEFSELFRWEISYSFRKVQVYGGIFERKDVQFLFIRHPLSYLCF